MSCGYQGYEFGGGYLDSVCVYGLLHDADSCDDDGNLYANDFGMPCPGCRPNDAIQYWAEQKSYGDFTKKEALEMARSLVNDIRKNRGLEYDQAAIISAERAIELRAKGQRP